MSAARVCAVWLTAGLVLCALPPAQAQDETIPVTITEVREELVAPALPAAGTVFSRNEAQITAGIAARLEWVAEPGDFVRAGHPVARFDCSLLSLQKEELQALAQREEINVAILTREARRQERLTESFSVAATQLDRTLADRDLAGSSLAIARVRVRNMEKQLERCVARAPFSGVVTQRFSRAGEDVERSTMLARMTDTRNLEVRVSLPVRHLPRLAVGSVGVVQLGVVRMEGVVRKIVPAADALSQTFEVRVELPEHAPEVLAAGQLVSVRLPLVASATLTVPRDSIVLREEGAFVMRINGDNEAERVFIEVADAEGERVSVRGSLAVGDRIAVRGAEALDDGQLVAVQADS